MEYDIFISYCRKDVKQIDKFVERLEKEGFRVWIDRIGIETGDSFKRVIVSAIEQCEVFVYFNSAHTKESIWTTKELGVATTLGKPIIPVKLDKASYCKEDLFDLINLDFIDWSDPMTHESMMEKFVNVVISKCPDRWEEILKEKSTASEDNESSEKNRIIKHHHWKEALTCLLVPFWGVIKSYHSFKNRKTERGTRQLLYTVIGFVWILALVILLMILKPFSTAPSKISKELYDDEWRFDVRGVDFVLKHVEGGSFLMGCDDEEADGDEMPVHLVTLSNYYICESEVTDALWDAVITKKRVWGSKRNMPHEITDNVDQINLFISSLNRLTGMSFRLPTEAEWEFAARGGIKGENNRHKFSGSNIVYEVAYYKDNGNGKVHKVKELTPNELGIYDMSGNLWELCGDKYGPYNPNGTPETNPFVNLKGQEMVIRGGCYKNREYFCRVSYRNSVEAENDNGYPLGFRLVLDDKKNGEVQSAEDNNDEHSESYEELVTITETGIPFNMIFVKGATFEMGGESDANDAEPIHKVTLSGYYIAETEVTQDLWESVMGTTVSDMRDKVDPNEKLYGIGDSYPMYYLNWNDCQEFIQRLNSITGRHFHLPTEAQWEFAARGGRTKGYKYSGSSVLTDVAWCSKNSGGQAHPVKKLAANALGVYDMNGNVWEWCQDWYDSYEATHLENPQGPKTGDFHVLRGASWNSIPERHGVSNRNNNRSEIRHERFGMRLAMDPE